MARDRSPHADVRVGDMQALPWPGGSFDVVTSFRGIWATTPHAIDEAFRVLRPGGRFGFTVWGDLIGAPGAWALAPFLLAAEEKVDNQMAMIQLADPDTAVERLRRAGFAEIDHVEVPFVWEFADAPSYVRALASTGPSYESIRHVGHDAFVAAALRGAEPHVREGLPLRAELPVVGYVARRPA